MHPILRIGRLQVLGCRCQLVRSVAGDAQAEGLLEYSIWKLKDVVIDSYSISASEDGIPEETWSLAYAAIEHTYKSTNQKTGKLENPIVFQWNVQTGKFEY